MQMAVGGCERKGKRKGNKTSMQDANAPEMGDPSVAQKQSGRLQGRRGRSKKWTEMQVYVLLEEEKSEASGWRRRLLMLMMLAAVVKVLLDLRNGGR